MKTLMLVMIILLCLTVPLHAQDDPYTIAQQTIEEFISSGEDMLDLSGLGLTELPPELWQITYLEWLDLSDNHLTRLPPQIGLLTNLKTLGVVGNRLTELPPEIGQLKRLEYLHLCITN